MKTPVLEFLFNRVAGPKTYLKEIPVHVLSCDFCELFKNTFFTDDLQAAASAIFWTLVNIQVTEIIPCNDTHFILFKSEYHCHGLTRNVKIQRFIKQGLIVFK